MAWSMSASETSFISPSTIMILSMVAATIISMSAPSNKESCGFITNFPLIRATRTSEIGPLNGMSETVSAAEAARAANASGAVSSPPEMRLINTWVSAWKSSGNKGRNALSTNREMRISCSEGRASRLKKPPGNFPVAAYFSLYSTESGMKSTSSLASCAATTVASIMVLPMRTTTEPSACLASFPVSMVTVLPSSSKKEEVIGSIGFII